jgi:hypothetical protein
MGGKKQPRQRGATSNRNSAPADGENAGRRQRRGDGERDAVADERERRADERERKADERERKADERERRADEREVQADRREAEAAEWARELDERARRLGVPAGEIMGHQAAESIRRSRALVAATRQRLQRREEALEREQDRTDRQQAQIDRLLSEGGRGRGAWLPIAGSQVERADALRERSCATIEAFAVAEDGIARTYDKLASSTPGHRDRYQRIAREARDAARKSREILRMLTSYAAPAARAGPGPADRGYDEAEPSTGSS